MTYEHKPVLCRELTGFFDFDRPAVVVDGTVGLGGHSNALLARYPDMTVIGLDWDSEALERTRVRLSPFGSRFVSVPGSYADLPDLLATQGRFPVDGILLDLGLSSLQIEKPDRGFSFSRSGPLDMRMSPQLKQTAWDLLTTLDAEALSDLFRTYGEERHSRRIAAALKKALREERLSNDTVSVAECIREALPYRGPSRIDPATRCFQALRIVVNRELDNLDHFLKEVPPLLSPGGRAAVISYHSLEDRAVKTAFRQAAQGCICPPSAPACVCGKKPWARLVTRKAVQASEAEISENPRARSARLRVLERIA